MKMLSAFAGLILLAGCATVLTPQRRDGQQEDEGAEHEAREPISPPGRRHNMEQGGLSHVRMEEVLGGCLALPIWRRPPNPLTLPSPRRGEGKLGIWARLVLSWLHVD